MGPALHLGGRQATFGRATGSLINSKARMSTRAAATSVVRQIQQDLAS